MIGRELRAPASMLDGDDRIDQSPRAYLPAPALGGVVAGRARSTSAVIAARSPRRSRKIVGVPPPLSAATSGSSSPRSSIGTGRSAHGSAGASGGLAGGRPLLAVGERLARGQARRLGGLRRDPRGVGLERESLQRGPDGGRRRPFARHRGGRGARAALLMSLISWSQSRAAASASSVVADVGTPAGTGPGRRPSPAGPRADRPRPPPRSALDMVLVVGALGGAHALGGRGRARPAPGPRARSARRRPAARRRTVRTAAPRPPAPAVGDPLPARRPSPRSSARRRPRRSAVRRASTASAGSAVGRTLGRRRRIALARWERRVATQVEPGAVSAVAATVRPPRRSPGYRGRRDAGPNRRSTIRSPAGCRIVDRGGRPGRRGPVRRPPWRRRRRTAWRRGAGSRPPRRSRGPRAERVAGRRTSISAAPADQRRGPGPGPGRRIRSRSRCRHRSGSTPYGACGRTRRAQGSPATHRRPSTRATHASLALLQGRERGW